MPSPTPTNFLMLSTLASSIEILRWLRCLRKSFKHRARVASLGEDQRLGSKFFHLDRRALCKPVRRWQHDVECVLKERNHFEVFLRNGQRNDSQVDLVLRELLQNLVTVVSIDADPDLREVLLEFGKDLREDVEAGGLVCSYDNLAAGRAVGFANSLQRFAMKRHEPFGMFKQNLAGLRQKNAPSQAVEELVPAFVLQGANLGANCRLRAIELFRRAGETLLPRNLQESV